MAKPQKNTYDDVKMLIATLSITMTLVFWHLFSASAADVNKEIIAANIQPVSVVVAAPSENNDPVEPVVTGTVYFGGQAPQPRVVVQRNNNGGGNNNNNSGGGGGAPVTQTKSS